MKKSVLKRFQSWLCVKLGHSFTAVDLLMFKLECEGRCFTVNLSNGERHISTRIPQIVCRRCGEVLKKDDFEFDNRPE